MNSIAFSSQEAASGVREQRNTSQKQILEFALPHNSTEFCDCHLHLQMLAFSTIKMSQAIFQRVKEALKRQGITPTLFEDNLLERQS